MKQTCLKFLSAFLLLISLFGCAGPQAEYRKAFDSQHSLKENECAFTQPAESIQKLVTQTFILQGFAVDSADSKSGIIKASRKMGDKEDLELTYEYKCHRLSQRCQEPIPLSC